MSVTIRPFTERDVPLVAALEAGTFSDPWGPGMFADELTQASRAWFVAEDDAALVGYGGVAVLADDDAHIMNLAVAPARRGQGIGRRLLEAIVAAAAAMGAQRVTLEVRSENDRSDQAVRVGGTRVRGRSARVLRTG